MMQTTKKRDSKKMKLTRIFVVLFLLLFSFSQTSINAQENTSESYQEGYRHGVISGRAVSPNINYLNKDNYGLVHDTREDYKKNERKYFQDAQYRQGWKDGFNKNVFKTINDEKTTKALELAQLTSEEDKTELINYFKWITSFNSSWDNRSKVFALNPKDRSKFYWSYVKKKTLDHAKKNALSKCGEGCELFAVNDKIVWQYAVNEPANNTPKTETVSQPSAIQPQAQSQNVPQQAISQIPNIQQQTQSQIITQQPALNQKSESQTVSQTKPAEQKTQSTPTVQPIQPIQQTQIQQPQLIQQPIVYAKPQLADRRIALVIGKYINAPLENPVNDSRAVGNVLKKLGFKTLEYENLSQKAMKRAIDDFGRQLRNYDVGLFFYAGHGTQIKGENYLGMSTK
ncbi:MAG: caspase family protein [Desulfamplus sp.]|nr:caspase family protein [Desulfamplus sp.]